MEYQTLTRIINLNHQHVVIEGTTLSDWIAPPIYRRCEGGRALTTIPPSCEGNWTPLSVPVTRRVIGPRSTRGQWIVRGNQGSDPIHATYSSPPTCSTMLLWYYLIYLLSNFLSRFHPSSTRTPEFTPRPPTYLDGVDLSRPFNPLESRNNGIIRIFGRVGSSTIRSRKGVDRSIVTIQSPRSPRLTKSNTHENLWIEGCFLAALYDVQRHALPDGRYLPTVLYRGEPDGLHKNFVSARTCGVLTVLLIVLAQSANSAVVAEVGNLLDTSVYRSLIGKPWSHMPTCAAGRKRSCHEFLIKCNTLSPIFRLRTDAF